MKEYKNKKWLEEKINTIGYKEEIGRLCGVSGDTIEYWRKKHGLENNISLPSKMRRYSYDETFFNLIDNEEKAYWLGFIMADGCITKSGSKNKSPNRLIIILNKKDKEHLEKFKNAIKSNSPITDKVIYDKRGFSTERSQFRVNSVQLCEDLQRYGIVQNKTGKETIPTSLIPDELIVHFIRGFFDGDGCIMKVYNNAYYRFRLGSCSLDIMKSIKNWFSDHFQIDLAIYERDKYSMPFYCFDCTNKNITYNFLNTLYSNAKVFLTRKMNLAQDMIDICSP